LTRVDDAFSININYAMIQKRWGNDIISPKHIDMRDRLRITHICWPEESRVSSSCRPPTTRSAWKPTSGRGFVPAARSRGYRKHQSEREPGAAGHGTAAPDLRRASDGRRRPRSLADQSKSQPKHGHVLSPTNHVGRTRGIHWQRTLTDLTFLLAEGEGFEPPERFPVQWFSSPVSVHQNRRDPRIRSGIDATQYHGRCAVPRPQGKSQGKPEGSGLAPKGGPHARDKAAFGLGPSPGFLVAPKPLGH
jgi:hypothetical protein